MRDKSGRESPSTISGVSAAGIALIVALTGYGCGPAAAGSSEGVVPERSDLTGSWTLNAQESDNPRNQVEQVRDAGERQPGMGGRRPPEGPPPGGMRGRPGMRGEQTPNIDPQRMQAIMQMAAEPPDSLILSQTDSTVTLRSSRRSRQRGRGQGERIVEFRTNGKNVEGETEQGWKSKTKAQWRGRELVVEHEVERGGKITRRYDLSPEYDQLFVLTELEVGPMRDPIRFRHVYDRAVAGAVPQ